MTIYFYLIAFNILASIALQIAASMGINIQTLLRIPLLNIRYVDLLVLLITIVSVAGMITRKNYYDGTLTILQKIILVFISTEIIQFIVSFGMIDFDSQISFLLASFGLFYIFHISNSKNVDPDVIKKLFFVIIIGYSIKYCLSILFPVSVESGGLRMSGDKTRIEVFALGLKESIPNNVMYPTVALVALFAHKLKIHYGLRIFLYYIITVSLLGFVVSFHRGQFATWIIMLSYWSYERYGLKKMMKIGAVVVLFFTILIVSYGNQNRGEGLFFRFAKLVEFSVSINDPDFSKGRFYVIPATLRLWEDKFLFGYGYVELQKYLPVRAASAHNLIVTSLFHRGIIGTVLLLSIYVMCYYYAVKLWKLTKTVMTEQRYYLRILVVVSFLWLIPAMTQEVYWVKYDTPVMYAYFGIIISSYKYYKGQEKFADEKN